MKAKKIISLVLAAVLGVSFMNVQFSAQETQSDKTVKIMCIGDSLTEGSVLRDGNYYDESGSWRKYLAASLNADGLDFKFTGVNYTNNSDMLEKDRWHCGKGGYSIGPDNNYVGNVDNELTRYLNCDADIILLMIGRNEYAGMGADPATSADKYYDLVGRIFAAKPNVKLFAASVPLMTAYDLTQGDFDMTDGAVSGLNVAIPQIVKSYRAMGYNMYFTDLSPEITGITPNDYAENDRVHFTDSGYEKIGAVWYNRIKETVASRDAEIASGISDDVSAYDGEIKNFDFSNWKSELVIDGKFEEMVENGVLVGRGTTGNDYGTWRVGGAWYNFDYGEYDIIHDVYKTNEKYAVDFNFSKWWVGNESDVRDNMQYWICLSRLDDNNRISLEFRPTTGSNDGKMTARLVRMDNGVCTLEESAEFDSTAGRLRIIVDGTKVSAAVGTKVWLKETEVGEMFENGIMRIFSSQYLGIDRFRFYTPASAAEEPEQVKTVDYSVNFIDLFKINEGIEGWTYSNLQRNDWSYTYESNAYGETKMYLESPTYSNNYSMKFAFKTGYIREDTCDMNFNIILSNGGGDTDSTANETAIRVRPHYYTDNHLITLEQRVNGKVIIEKAYIGDGQFSTDKDSAFIVDNTDGKVTVKLETGDEVKTLFENVEMTIPAGRMGYRSWWIQNYMHSFSVKAVNTATETGDVNGDGNIDILDLIAMKKLAVKNEYTEAADMNGDGKVNATDLTLLRQALLLS